MSVLTKEVKNNVLYIRINRPEKLNALNTAVIEEIADTVSNIETFIKVVVFCGCENAFSVGVDISEFSDLNQEKIYNLIDDKWQSVSKIRVPVICAVSGYVLGGGFELALMSDIIIAGDTAKFGFPEINLGIMPGNGGTQRLVQTVGKHNAMQMLFTGEMIDAHKAIAMGIVNTVVPQCQLLEYTKNIAEKIAERNYDSLIKIKKAVSIFDNSTIENGLIVEKEEFRSLFFSNFAKDKIKQFLEKQTSH